jgi:hypothetical protein
MTRRRENVIGARTQTVAVAALALIGVAAAATVSQSSPLFFTFRPHWDSINVSAAPAVGGWQIAVSGSGFRAGDDAYTCEFSMGARHASSPARPSSGSLIFCKAPYWPYSAGLVHFSLNHHLSGVPQDTDDFDAGSLLCSLPSVADGAPAM